MPHGDLRISTLVKIGWFIDPKHAMMNSRDFFCGALQLVAALAKLPEEAQRESLVQHDWTGLPLVQITKQLGRSRDLRMRAQELVPISLVCRLDLPAEEPAHCWESQCLIKLESLQLILVLLTDTRSSLVAMMARRGFGIRKRTKHWPIHSATAGQSTQQLLVQMAECC